MNPFENHGIIIRELRKLRGWSVRKAALEIHRGIGWLSEIENGTGTARLTEDEFERIVTVMDGHKCRAMFKTWTANHKNQERVDKTFDGAVLKYIRIKKELTLVRASQMMSVSYAHLSKIESGKKPITLALRCKIMSAYGYSPSSFKNLSTDPVRSKAVPALYKLNILLKTFSSEQIESLLQIVLTKNF